MAINDVHAASFATFTSGLVDSWLQDAPANDAFKVSRKGAFAWSFEREVAYTYWALQPEQTLEIYFAKWTLDKMKESFWDSRKHIKTFGKIRYLRSICGSAISTTTGNLLLLSQLMKKPNELILYSLHRNTNMNQLTHFFPDRNAPYLDRALTHPIFSFSRLPVIR